MSKSNCGTVSPDSSEISASSKKDKGVWLVLDYRGLRRCGGPMQCLAFDWVLHPGEKSHRDRLGITEEI